MKTEGKRVVIYRRLQPNGVIWQMHVVWKTKPLMNIDGSVALPGNKVCIEWWMWTLNAADDRVTVTRKWAAGRRTQEETFPNPYLAAKYILDCTDEWVLAQIWQQRQD